MTAPAYDGPPVEEIALPVIDRLQVLPYFSSWWQWEQHLDECQHCMTVMAVGPVADIGPLCPEGQIAATAARWDVRQQHESAKYN